MLELPRVGTTCFGDSCSSTRMGSWSALQRDGVNELRRVELELPPGGEQLLCLVPGYSDFNPVTEALVMLKPGFGLKDAPGL